MARLYANNFSTTLGADLTDVATTLTLTSATGFPAVGSGDTAQVTISDGTNTEVVTATAISGSDVTITRGQEGTSGTAFLTGDVVEIRETALSFTDVLAGDETPQLRGPLDLNSNYVSFGGSSTSTQFNIISNGGVPRIIGFANFFVDFTSSLIELTAGSSNNQLAISNSSGTGTIIKTGGTTRLQVNDSGVTSSAGDFIVPSDTYGLKLGAGGDATIIYNGTNLVINPQAVGSGDFVQSAGNFQVAGVSFDSGTNVLDHYEAGSFTPTWTNLTVGNGTSIGRYTRVGEQVTVYIELTLGSTSSMGSGPEVSNLPFTVNSDYLAFGQGSLGDTGTNTYDGLCVAVKASTRLVIQRRSVSGSNISHQSLSATTPFTWTTGDLIRMSITYSV